MSGDKSIFIELKELNGYVTFGDDSKVQVKDKGKILNLMKNEEHQYISNVYYVPSKYLEFGTIFG